MGQGLVFIDDQLGCVDPDDVDGPGGDPTMYSPVQERW
jgi:hypothetical protein